MTRIEQLVSDFIEANGELEFSMYQLDECSEDERELWEVEVEYYHRQRQVMRELILEYNPTEEEVKQQPLLEDIINYEI